MTSKEREREGEGERKRMTRALYFRFQNVQQHEKFIEKLTVDDQQRKTEPETDKRQER